jgi:hypothetical protein
VRNVLKEVLMLVSQSADSFCGSDAHPWSNQLCSGEHIASGLSLPMKRSGTARTQGS